mmetsp:Transcript_14715/g.38264  ORF Transcript_14715/g.38264 Transcript_14715/m.38264 type:complete len:232 (-) Transcript_14715:1062-1757(-)
MRSFPIRGTMIQSQSGTRCRRGARPSRLGTMAPSPLSGLTSCASTSPTSRTPSPRCPSSSRAARPCSSLQAIRTCNGCGASLKSRCTSRWVAAPSASCRYPSRRSRLRPCPPSPRPLPPLAAALAVSRAGQVATCLVVAAVSEVAAAAAAAVQTRRQCPDRPPRPGCCARTGATAARSRPPRPQAPPPRSTPPPPTAPSPSRSDKRPSSANHRGSGGCAPTQTPVLGRRGS